MNLRELVDYNKLFTMIYSGIENNEYFDLLYSLGIRDFLMSYHYIVKKGISISKRFAGKDDIKLFVDSGAFTYQGDLKYQNTSIAEWEKLLKSYLAWARKNKDYLFAIANFDFENIVGGEVVKRWNKEYFEPFMLDTGIVVCFVWHQDSALSWEEYCQRYPYVGLSSVSADNKSLDLKDFKKHLQVAQKYNTVVHGFGMTQTSLLPKLPYYTVDSTTWLVGLQYGEINYWNGKKMSRLKKVKWHKMQSIFERMGINFKKLKAEDKIELIKANIIAFIEAEEFIRTRLRNIMYWLKKETVENDLSDDTLFPSFNWLTGESDFEGWEHFAKRLNISPNNKDLAINAVIDCTVFCNWEEEDYAEFVQKGYIEKAIIGDVHDQYINQIRANDDDRIADLRQFFEDVASGKNDKLMSLGGANVSRPKEREEYVEEDLYDTVEISAEEVQEAIKGILPSGNDSSAPDIDKLEDEIFLEKGIVPVRDKRGRLVKGQQIIRKPKQLYSDKYPKLACNTCYAAQTCPDYQADMVCAYNKMFKRFDSRNMSDVIESMQGMVNLNLERMQRQMMFEILDGGQADGTLTGLIEQNMRLMMNMKQLYDHASDEILRQTRVVRPDGTMQETTELQNPSSGGILEKLFSASLKKEEPEDKDDKIIDAEIEIIR